MILLTFNSSQLSLWHRNGIMGLHQHHFRWWFVAWQHQSITLTDADASSVGLLGTNKIWIKIWKFLRNDALENISNRCHPFCRQHFQMYFLGRKFCFLKKISLKLVPRCPIGNESTLVHVMARYQTDDMPLPEPICCPIFMTKHGITKPRLLQTSNITHTLLGNKPVDHSDGVGASPDGAAPTTSSFSTYHLAKTSVRCDEKHVSFGTSRASH